MKDISYDTVTEAVSDLKKRGFDLDFNMRETYLECTTNGRQLSPKDFEITEFYRFEGDSDPGDEMVVYAIESHDGLKGTLVNAFGPYSNSTFNELIAKLNVHEH